MSFLEIYGVTYLVLIAFMTVIWVLSLIAKDASLVDLVWGMGFVVASACYFIMTTDGWIVRKVLIAGMFGIWGLRLSLYLTWRKIRQQKGEDYRYTRMRNNIGPAFWWRSWITVFFLQGTTIWLLSIVSLGAQYSPGPQYLTVFDLAGAALWAVGFYFETVGDLQLAAFKANPANKGKIMRSGLWGLTRHPNYFGDAVMWWGYWLVALSVPFGFITIGAPVIMTFLLLRVSGVAMLEKDMAAKRPEYAEYMRDVPAFVPRMFSRPFYRLIGLLMRQ